MSIQNPFDQNDSLQRDSNKDVDFFIQEVARCMKSLMDKGEFPEDSCPADLFHYAVELGAQ